MKAHKYWSVGALITMLGTFYTGHKMLSGKIRNKKEVSVESVED